jgi:hypothetical protein
MMISSVVRDPSSGRTASAALQLQSLSEPRNQFGRGSSAEVREPLAGLPLADPGAIVQARSARSRRQATGRGLPASPNARPLSTERTAMSFETPGAGTAINARLIELNAEERYARERHQLSTKVKVYGSRLTSPGRLRELERSSKLANWRLDPAKGRPGATRLGGRQRLALSCGSRSEKHPRAPHRIYRRRTSAPCREALSLRADFQGGDMGRVDADSPVGVVLVNQASRRHRS